MKEINDNMKKVLLEINKKQGIHKRDLLLRTGLNFNELSKAIEELENKKLISSNRHGGYIFYYLTDEGRKVLSEIIEESQREESSMI